MGSIPIARSILFSYFLKVRSIPVARSIPFSGLLKVSPIPIARSTLLVVLLLAAPAAASPAPDGPAVALSSAGAGVSVSTAAAAPAPRPVRSPATPALARARALYFSGDVLASAAAFEAAVKASSTDASAWLDGSFAWAEAGRPDQAVAWARRAAALSADAEPRAELGWALLRAAQAPEADAVFSALLAREPGSGWAALGAGRAKLALGRPADAVPLFKRAAGFAPQRTTADFYLGRAEEELGDSDAAAEAYRRAVASDAYFHEGRDPLVRAYLRQKRYADAWRQLGRLAEAEPSGRLTRTLMDKVRPLLPASAERPAPAEPRPVSPRRAPVAAASADSETKADIPAIRVGLGVTAMGTPRPRVSVTVRGSGAWRATDPKTGREIASCAAQDAWTIRLVPPQRTKGKGKKKKTLPARLELRGPDGQVRAAPGDQVRLAPEDPVRGALMIEDDPDRKGPFSLGRALRGSIEVALFNRRRSLRLVNVVNLEDYTQGVVGAEMPSGSPLEALKAQALIARTHALFIKTVSPRHKKEGYDVCDGQHCQVYAGLRAEDERTRAAVAATRGRVATYKGRLALVIYSSNCGGSSQSGDDIGWGHVPYWSRTSDSPRPVAPPDSPSELRRFLTEWPDAYCKPSGDVHPSHSRWTRVVSARDLEERVNRKRKIGKLKGLRALRRAPSGNVEALLVLGSRRNATLTGELDIRNLLGVGSLRSTLFVMDVEYRVATTPPAKAPKGKKPAKSPPPALVPEAFVFHGGGWGHGVGLCQSGAMGRASAGQDYEAIVKAYFAGVEISTLDYVGPRP